jgi:hypothetical protein
MVLINLLSANVPGEKQRMIYSANVTGQERIFGKYPHPSLADEKRGYYLALMNISAGANATTSTILCSELKTRKKNLKEREAQEKVQPLLLFLRSCFHYSFNYYTGQPYLSRAHPLRAQGCCILERDL